MRLRGRRLGAVAVTVVLLMIVLLFQIGGSTFGWRTGDLLKRPTLADCEAVVGEGSAPVTSLDVTWVWSANGFGWGCRVTRSDGSSGVATGAAGAAERRER